MGFPERTDIIFFVEVEVLPLRGVESKFNASSHHYSAYIHSPIHTSFSYLSQQFHFHTRHISTSYKFKCSPYLHPFSKVFF